ncbi:MAG: GTPase Era [Clostridiales bacterium]|jgi:GTP-binding protein Era|nr:GTPase Era [Clostridiales bacterium]
MDINTQGTQGTQDSKSIKVGFFAIIGKPNVGKSSLLNNLVGQKVSIVSYKPQTTRNKITGIYTDDFCQFVFLDTPGFVQSDNKLAEFMTKQIKSATDGVDGLLFVVDCTKPISTRELQSIQHYAINVPTIVLVNKTDLTGYQDVYPVLNQLNTIKDIYETIAISARTGDNLYLLKHACGRLSNNSVQHYDQSQVTDRSVRFIASELIREKILLYYQQEIPHGIGVVITNFVDKPNIARIDADIICNKTTHKPILIGKHGSGIKKIGTQARLDIERLIDKQVNLQLYVKVRENWKNNNNYLNDIGYDIKE